jgi:hypothetical protein
MADVETTALGSETLNLMEQVVHWGNIDVAASLPKTVTGDR